MKNLSDDKLIAIAIHELTTIEIDGKRVKVSHPEITYSAVEAKREELTNLSFEEQVSRFEALEYAGKIVNVLSPETREAIRATVSPV